MAKQYPITPTGLLKNELTLSEHQERLARSKWRPLTRDEAVTFYGGEAAQDWFGDPPEAVRAAERRRVDRILAYVRSINEPGTKLT